MADRHDSPHGRDKEGPAPEQAPPPPAGANDGPDGAAGLSESQVRRLAEHPTITDAPGAGDDRPTVEWLGPPPETGGRQKTERMSPAAMDRLAQRRADLASGSTGSPEPPCPERIGKYAVSEVLGRGGMGEVYRGHHPELDIPVAIKVIRPVYAGNPGFISRFLREARLATKLTHPNIVRVHDADQHNGMYFMVQEFVDGGDLHDAITGAEHGSLDPEQALRIMTDIASALVAAEKLNIVHRDIKPRNILITKDGEPKLADLGLARHYTPEGESPITDAEVTQAGSTIGSPYYMAPEQIDDPRGVDIRTDIYALGVTFYQALTGEVPFSGSSLPALCMQKLQLQRADPCKVNHDIPRRIARVVETMMRPSPGDRQQTAVQLLADLQRASRPFLKRHGAWLSAAATFLVLLLMSVTIARRSRPEHDPRREALDCLAEGEHERAVALLEEALATEPSEVRALYALGLCYVEMKEGEKLDEIRQRLSAVEDGVELAKHLEVLQLIDGGKNEAALQIIDQWTTKARYRLPFLDSKAAILIRQDDLPQARQCLGAAMDEASLFSFQRFSLFDRLGKLFASEGDKQKARDTYAQALSQQGGAGATPVFRTNYAFLLMDAGDREEAGRQVRLALQGSPDDELGLHLQRRLQGAEGAVSQSRIRQTMEMIDEVSAALSGLEKDEDEWSSRPLVLTFLPPENLTPLRARLAEGEMLRDELSEALQSKRLFAVVDRDALDHMLREHKISASDLASSSARLRVGEFLPASILIRPRIEVDDRLTVSLRLVDVASSRIVSVLREEAERSKPRRDVARGLAEAVLSALAEEYPLKGKVVSHEAGVCQINVGRYHGVRKGVKVGVHEARPSVSAGLLRSTPPLATGEVVDVTPFTATVRLGSGGKPVGKGMLVVEVPAP